MSAPTERELKLSLPDPDELPRLLAALPAATAVLTQDNLYFVEPGAPPERARIMVRLRQERRDGADGRWLLTVKSGSQAVDGYFVAEEREAELDEATAARIAADPSALLGVGVEPARWLTEEAGVGALVPLGGMRNRRHLVPCAGFLLEVDRTEFPGGVVEAEVEVETERADEARALLLEVAERAGVRLVAQTLGKFTRFRVHLAAATSV
ncbi:MAG: CYTH domain-containing protein [Deltaproteobacteria bacterium]|nr:CYTH domain-containing protein [Deltaproteobacteria bacterium]MCB9787282.1 CYTH domain-containing protein [Deltaproteobacteria bacterium]